MNHIGVEKWLAKITISEWKQLLELGNSNLGSNFKCQSTIHNSAKNLPFYLVNHIGVKKWLAKIAISEWKWLLAIGNSNLGSNF